MYPLKKGKTPSAGPRRTSPRNLRRGAREEGVLREVRAPLSHATRRRAGYGSKESCGPIASTATSSTPTDQTDPNGRPVAFLGNNDVRALRSRAASAPMPFYFRNADGDELYFVHRGKGTIETDFGPMPFEKGDYIVDPPRRHVPRRPRNHGQFLSDRGVEDRVRTAGERADRAARALRSRRDRHARARADIWTTDREWEVRIKVEEEFSSDLLSVQPDRRRRLEGRPDRLEDSTCATSARS